MPPRPDRRTLLTALAAGLAMGAGPGRATGLSGVTDPPGGPPMACAGVIARRRDGSVIFQGAAGIAGVAPFTLQRPFRVASISKMVATTAFLPLAQRTGLDLDADASDFVGFRLRHPAHPEVAITPRMLLSHTSGLRNGPSYPVPLGHKLSEAFEAGGRHYDAGGWFGPAEHPPGAWFAYADVNFALVAQMLERRAGERFDLHMNRVLFRPLDLDIGYNWSGVSQAKRALAAPAVHRIDGAWAAQVDGAVLPVPQMPFTRPADQPRLDAADYRLGDNGFVFSPQGGLRLSLSDMDVLARLYAAHGLSKGRQLIPRAALEAMQTRAWTFDPVHPSGEPDNGLVQSYGLGCEAPLGRPGPAGDAFFGAGDGDWRGHFGDAYGWITGLFWNRRDGRTLVYAIDGMPEKDRPRARSSSLTAPEETLIALALGA
jgi:CubicO group peptidase (beta-lactamase class C family)